MAGRHTLARSFAVAWNGLAESALRGRNFRIHLALGVLAGAFAARAPLSPGGRGLVVLCIALVLAAEAMNSALEAAVDLAAPGQDERARVAKDAAAAPVLWLPATGAAVASAATLLLPAPSPRSRVADLLLASAAVAGLILAAQGARGWSGLVAAVSCLAIAVAAAARRRKLGGRG